MGCDIHAFIECPIPDAALKPDEGSHYVSALLDLDRNYTIFAALDGTNRRDPPFLIPSRGLPTGIARETREQYEEWQHDAHSPSYITTEDATSLDELATLDPEWQAVLCILKNVPDSRLVFWFDN